MRCLQLCRRAGPHPFPAFKRIPKKTAIRCFNLYFRIVVVIYEAMASVRTYSALIERLKRSDLRPTRQRLALAKLMFEKGDGQTVYEARDLKVGLFSSPEAA